METSPLTKGLEGSGQRFKGTNWQQIVNEAWRSNAQYNAYRPQYCIVIIKLAKKLELNYSKH